MQFPDNFYFNIFDWASDIKINDFEEEGVQNVTVKTVTFRNTHNGARIKSWGRPSKGLVKDVLFQQATMINVQNPILIDQNYCPDNINCPGQVNFYIYKLFHFLAKDNEEFVLTLFPFEQKKVKHEDGQLSKNLFLHISKYTKFSDNLYFNIFDRCLSLY